MNQKDVIPARDLLDALADLNLVQITEARCLLTIAAAEEPLTVSELAHALKLPMSTVSRVTWNLVELKLVAYAEHATDRRRKLLTANMKKLNGGK